MLTVAHVKLGANTRAIGCDPQEFFSEEFDCRVAGGVALTEGDARDRFAC